jgi:hypothetical protein
MLGNNTLTEENVTGNLAEVLHYERGGLSLWQAIVQEVKVSLTFIFSSTETLLGLQSTEVPARDSSDWALIWV